MRIIFRLALPLLLLLSLIHVSSLRTAAGQQTPKIASVRVQGKKLIITGESFSPGAVILINGEKQKTKNDAAEPSTRLIVKKGGKKIRDGEVTSLRVENAGGILSNEFGFFDGPSVSLEDGGKTITLRVGERFLVILKSPERTWTVTQFDPAVIRRVADAELIEGAQGVFEAIGRGQTDMIAIGELPCHKLDPPCMALTAGFDVKIVVE